jgi:hypothetical protein
MSARAELLKRLESEIEAAQAKASARERCLHDMLTSDADEGNRDERWQALCQRLETYRLALEARITDSSNQVAQAEGNHAEIEAAVCTWVADVQKLTEDFQPQT